MEEVIKKSDGQFKDILEELVDYKKHVDKKDPLIKELSRPKANTTKPPASINSSTYSSAASSASDHSSSHSSSSSASSSSSTSSSASSSKSSSPSQSQVGLQNGPTKNQPSSDYGKLEMAKMEDLGKTANFLEHRLPSVLRTIPVVVATSNPRYVSHYPLTQHNKKYTSEDYDETNINNDNDSSSNVTAQKYATTNGCNLGQTNTNGLATTSSAIISAGNSWKTINAKRDKRRKKPVERKILAKEIPGHRGDLTVEELTKFIESGTNGTSSYSSNNNKNNRSKPQNNSNGISNNSNQNNIGSNSNNINNTNSIENSINNNGTKKNESQQITTKPAQTSTKINNTTNQSKNPPPPPQPSQPIQNQQPMINQNEQIQVKQQAALIEQPREAQLQKNNNHKPLQQAQQQPKQANNHATRQSQTQRRTQQPMMGPPSPQPPKLQHQQQTAQNHTDQFQVNLKQDQKQSAVIFAEHIRVREEDVCHYTFGFFEDQPSPQAQPNKQMLNNHNSHMNNTRKLTSQSQPIQIEQKQKPKQSKASPNSEENCYKSKDNFEVHNFNYDQILKFISSAWEATVANSQNH